MPPDAVYGRIVPEGPGPMTAEMFEERGIDEDNPAELIGGWVMPVPPIDFETGEHWVDLISVLRSIVRSKGWRISQDARHHLPSPPTTIVFPDIVIHATSEVHYLPGTRTVGRVPDLVIEILSEETHERDMAPHGAKFLAYQMSGVREYYYCWPDGRDASGFVLRRGVFTPLRRDREGFFTSTVLGVRPRLVEAATEPLST